MSHPLRKNAANSAVRSAIKTYYFLPVFVLAGLFAGDKAEFWERKDSGQWSQKECRKLLEDSPWVKQHVIASPFTEKTKKTPPPAPPPPAGTKENPRSAGPPVNPKQVVRSSPPPVVRYTVQLRSANPILQAVQRLNQLTGKSSGSFPAGGRGFGDSPGPDQSGHFNPIIVHVICKSDNRMVDWSLFNYWTKQSIDRLKDFVSLNGEKGAKVQVARYVSPYFYRNPASKDINNEFDFVFPRRVEGREVLSVDDEYLELDFPHPNLVENAQIGNQKGRYDTSRGRDDFIKGLNDFTECTVRFKTDKMKYQGSLTY